MGSKRVEREKKRKREKEAANGGANLSPKKRKSRKGQGKIHTAITGLSGVPTTKYAQQALEQEQNLAKEAEAGPVEQNYEYETFAAYGYQPAYQQQPPPMHLSDYEQIYGRPDFYWPVMESGSQDVDSQGEAIADPSSGSVLDPLLLLT